MGFQFQYFDLIWLMGGTFVLFRLFWRRNRWKRRVLRSMGEPELVTALIRRYTPRKASLKFILILFAFAFGVLAVMSLRKPGGDDGIRREGIDVVFALDLSKSMLATDIAPSRLERAKKFISDMINAMPENRIGLVWFAGRAYVQMPISGDHGAAQMFVAEANPDIIPVGGTVIGEALEQSLKAFGAREAKYKAVILISDGEDHDEKAVDISRELARRGLMLITVGIGSPQGSYIPDDSTGGHKIDPETGQPVVSRLNEAELKQIAQNTNGLYVHLDEGREPVKAVLKQLSQIDKKVSGDINLMSFTYYFWIFTGLMLILLIIEILLPEGKETKL